LPTLKQLAELVGGKTVGNSDVLISGISEIQNGKPDTITFLANTKYTKFLHSTKADAIVVSDESILNGKNGIVVSNPQLAFSILLNNFRPKERKRSGIHPTASVDSSVKLGKQIFIGAYAVIEQNVILGDGTHIGSHSIIGRNAVVGKEGNIHSRVVLYHDCSLGDRVTVFSGSVIGSDGFGFVTENNVHHKIPQIGKVIVGSDVEIGANCTIDRATLGATIIGNMTKLDNQVHIAHNVKIGKGCLLAAKVGIAGSAIIEDFCIFAGQSGVIPHVTVGPKSIVAAQSGVTKSLDGGEIYAGMPARKIREQHQKDAVLSSISSLKNRIKSLEKIVSKNEHSP